LILNICVKNNQEKKLTPLLSIEPLQHDLKSKLGQSNSRKKCKSLLYKVFFLCISFRKLLRNFHFLERKRFSVPVRKVSQIGER